MKATTKTTQNLPCGWIVNPKDKGRRSIKSDNKIYLEDNSEFEIELFNPLTSSVLCDIKVNGNSISKNGLVLRPGERFYLDCFLDNKKKFIFNTYFVDNLEESKKAISNNGVIEIFFYKESVDLFKIHNNYYYYPYYYQFPTWYVKSIYNATPVYNATVTYTQGNNFNVNMEKYQGYCNGIARSTNDYGTLRATTNTSTIYLSNLNSNITNQVETGRVEGGSMSSQVFGEVDMNFQTNYISSVVYKILPESKKPIETKEISESKKFCSDCGTPVRITDKFCYKCGFKL